MNLNRFPKRVRGTIDCSGNPATACNSPKPEPSRSCIRLVRGSTVRCCCQETGERHIKALSS
jgi:hypothetical protein